eukprot:gene11163-14980_t
MLKRSPTPVILSNVSIDVAGRGKLRRLLHPVTTTIQGGCLFGILGGSGSGKTTLLNVIAGRYDIDSLHVGGTVSFDGKLNCSVGYVTQNDYLLPFLTVNETLIFEVKMKISLSELDQKEHQYQSLVDGVILNLGLKEVTHSLVGETRAGGKR